MNVFDDCKKWWFSSVHSKPETDISRLAVRADVYDAWKFQQNKIDQLTKQNEELKEKIKQLEAEAERR